MSIPHLSVKRPVTTLMLSVAMIVLGLVTAQRLPVALFPDLNFPFAVAVAEYPNVGPFEMETQVTRPLEEAIATVGNIKNVSSITMTGRSTVIAEFNWGTNMDFAALEMRERIDLARSALPDGVSSVRIFRFDPTQDAILHINVGGNLDGEALRKFAEDQVKPRLERIEGVASVAIEGGLEREIQIAIDPTRLEQHGVSYDQVKQALSASNLNLPAGTVQENGIEWILRTVGEFERIRDIEQVVVQAGPRGIVRLADVATVIDGYKETRQLSRLNGIPSVTVSVHRESTGNTVAVSARVHEEVRRLQEEYGRDVDLEIVWDEARFIRSSIRSLAENAVAGALFATIVLFLFLRNWRTTLIVATTIPTAAIATFSLLYFSGTSINMLSLGGFALGVGMLVDNGIVVIENIFRRRQEGDALEVAAAEGAAEVGRALLASTLTTLAVFMPVVFLEGFAAEVFRDLSFAVSFAITMSLVVAVTLVPMLASRFLGNVRGVAPSQSESDEALAGSQRDTDPLEAPPGRYGRFVGGYMRVLNGVLQRRWIGFVGAMVLVIGGAAGASRLGMAFMPTSDMGEFTISVEMPAGTSLAETDRVVRQMERYLADHIPELDMMLSSVGGTRPDQAQINVTLVELAQRQRGTDEVIEQVRRFAATLPGVKTSVEMTDMVGGAHGGGGPVQVHVKGADLDVITAYAESLAAKMRDIRGLREVDTSVSQARPELQVRIDRDRAAALGLNVFQIASTLRTAVEGEITTRFRVGGDELDVRIQLAEPYRSNPRDIERILIDTPLGLQVPLLDVARIVQGVGPVEILRDGQERVVRVSAHLFQRDLGSAMAEVRQLVASEPLPQGVSVEYAGEDEMMRDAFTDLAFALVLAVVLVYMILAAQYESLTQPFIIMFAMPVAAIGAIWGLVATGLPLSVPGFIGVIMVVGIVINNNIVLVDYINQLRDRGYRRREAMLWGCRTRLRPVLMTTATTVLAMVPLALGIGEGAEIQQPIAVVTISGLLLATALTLLLVPVVYSVVDDVTRWIGRIVFRRGAEEQEPSAAV